MVILLKKRNLFLYTADYYDLSKFDIMVLQISLKFAARMCVCLSLSRYISESKVRLRGIWLHYD